MGALSAFKQAQELKTAANKVSGGGSGDLQAQRNMIRQGNYTGDPRLNKRANKATVFEQGLGDLRQEQQRGLQQTTDMYSPYMKTGGQAFDMQAALSGALGPEAQQQAYGNFQQSPGQQFLQQQAEKALLRNSAATGNLGGGGTKTALQQQAVGFAQQDFDNYYNRLGGISGAGLGFTESLGGMQANAANNMGSNIAGMYNTRLGQQKAPSNTMHGGDYLAAAAGLAGGILSDITLKEDLNLMGVINNINIYNWKWNKKAESIGLKGREYGVIAQEIQKINPDAVIKGDYLSIDLAKVSKMLG